MLLAHLLLFLLLLLLLLLYGVIGLRGLRLVLINVKQTFIRKLEDFAIRIFSVESEYEGIVGILGNWADADNKGLEFLNNVDRNDPFKSTVIPNRKHFLGRNDQSFGFTVSSRIERHHYQHLSLLLYLSL